MASARVFNHVLHRKHAIIANISNTCVLYKYNFHIINNVKSNVCYSTKTSVSKIDPAQSKGKIQVGFAEVAKENTKSAGYLGVIIVGIGITAYFFYAIFDELFSRKSPNGVYAKALEDCMKHPEVLDMLGQPIKAFGEENRRGRRNHVSHKEYTKDNVKHMRMQFYLQGIRRRGTVSLEVQEDEAGKYVYRYLYVIVDDIVRTIIRIADNREGANNYSDNLEPALRMILSNFMANKDIHVEKWHTKMLCVRAVKRYTIQYNILE